MDGKSIVENVRLPREKKLVSSRPAQVPELTVDEFERLRIFIRSYLRHVESNAGWKSAAAPYGTTGVRNDYFQRLLPILSKLIGEETIF
jgi:hypothetical protein